MSAPSATAYDAIRGTVLGVVERERLDLDQDLADVRRTVAEAVDGYQRRARLGDGTALRDPADMAGRVLRSITAFGPLTELLLRPDVEEIFVEGARVTYLDASGRLQALAAPTTEEENRQVVDRLLSATQRRLDAGQPLVQARVLDGRARLTAAIPPLCESLSATIRRHTLRRETLASLRAHGSLTRQAADFLWAVMQASTSVLVSGPPGSGKTSTLSALLAAAPTTHCIRCCEEIRELNVPLPHGSYYEARPAGLDGSAEVSLRDLVKFMLAMRPDRIVVGEVRGSEAFELTRAVNAGCGFACTVHANSARDALTAIVNAAIMAGENVTEPIVRRVFAAAIDLVVHLDFDTPAGGPGDGIRRQVTEILAVVPSLHDDFSTEPIFARAEPGAPLLWTGSLPPSADTIDRRLPGSLTLRGLAEGRGVGA
ncbi:ATPase, T2SS/T4P/T4SS family [soil metagenome]